MAEPVNGNDRGGNSNWDKTAEATSADFKDFLQAGFDLAKEAREGFAGSRAKDVVGWATGGALGGGSATPDMRMPTEEQLQGLHDSAGKLREEMVDLMNDAVKIFDETAKWMMEVTKPAAQPAGAQDAAPAAAAPRGRVISPEVALARAGGEARVPFVARNPLWQQLDQVEFVCEGLWGPTGEIPPFDGDEKLIDFKPGPMVLRPREAKSVDMVVQVPRDLAPGMYTGMVRIRGVPGTRYLVAIEVVPAAGGGQ